MVGALKPMVNTPGSRRLKPLFLRSFSQVCGLLFIRHSAPSTVTLG